MAWLLAPASAPVTGSDVPSPPSASVFATGKLAGPDVVVDDGYCGEVAMARRLRTCAPQALVGVGATARPSNGSGRGPARDRAGGRHRRRAGD